ncbi:NAD-P-binding protein [Polyporus arcularius HHB13444]|uniref:NAD-P-binding protein n=1 Tax=Polyporus arcularius HHB13444 TaxID=1314778 RepID=A0A5C3P9V8_9APHY|nr:NAD-P-binding protein [Polyporus arcularius HHB13444]
MSTGYRVAIVGGTGRLGKQIVDILVSEYRTQFPIVRVLTRDPTSDTARNLQAKGAELHMFDEANVDGSLATALSGVDVVVNALPSATTPLSVKKQVQTTAITSGARVYFLSEFGVDHRQNDFPGYDHHEWAVKRELAEDARTRAAGNVKIVAVYSGLFLEGAFRVTGYDLENNTYSCVGSPAQRIAFTSTADIGRTVAELACLALDSETASHVGGAVRIAGTVVSYEHVRDMVAKIKGLERGAISTGDLWNKKRELQEQGGQASVLDYIRVLMGEGKLDFSGDNVNELVNPRGTRWRWKSAYDQLETQLL